MTRENKIKFLQDLKAGKKTVLDILRVHFMAFYNINGVITDNDGKVYTDAEINAHYSMTLNKTWVEILTYDRQIP